MYLRNGILVTYWTRWKLADLFSYSGRENTRVFLIQDEPSIYGIRSKSVAYFAKSTEINYIVDGRELHIHIPATLWKGRIKFNRCIVLEYENEFKAEIAYGYFNTASK